MIMKKLATALALTIAVATAVACSDDETGAGGTVTNVDAGASSSGTSGTSGSSGSSGTSGSAGDDDDDDTKADAGDAGKTVSCEAAKETTLGPIDKVTVGEVKTVVEAKDSKTIYVDATAVSSPEAKNNPRVYINLETLKRVDITDKQAPTSNDWDLAIKRSVFFTNGGDGGKGQGGAKFFKDKDFGTLTTADAVGLTTESFFDADCNAQKDDFGAVKTSFSGWYDYRQSDNHLTPFAGTWVVKGATGKLYKLAILTFYAKADGTEGTASDSAHYTLKIAPLQ